MREESHEQELMNFAPEEYDAGASLHVNQLAMPSTLSDSNRVHLRPKRGTSLVLI